MPRKFLIIDDNPDSRFLLNKTLVRKFSSAKIMECGDEGTALAIAATEKLDAIVIHRTAEMTGLDLLPRLRQICASVPIVMVSGIDRSAAALAAGANYFLLYDEWLRLGTVVAGLLAFRTGSQNPFGTGEADPQSSASCSL
jgi:DNA-binding response OmpR family regulator